MKFEEVWERREGFHEMSLLQFVITTMVVVTFGTFTVFLSSFMFRDIGLYEAGFWIQFFAGMAVLALGIWGIDIAKKSNSWIVSLCGFMLVTVPYGILLGPALMEYSNINIFNAFILSLCYVTIFGIIGLAVPDNLNHWLDKLVKGLLAAIVVYILLGALVGLLFPSLKFLFDFWHIAVIVLFAFITMYDFNRLKFIDRTKDNSVDAAIGIYLDYANVALNFLGLSGRNNN